MKFVCSLTFSFLLFSFIANHSLVFSNDDGRGVVDTAFWPVITYGRYYFIPTFLGIRGGRLRLEKTGGSNCPVTILLQDQSNENYLPVRFTNLIDVGHDGIITGAPIEIEFTKNKPDCTGSSKWLIFIDNVINKFCVGIGGPENYPGMQIVNGTFSIQRYGLSYNLAFCVDGSSSFCSNVGYYNNYEGGVRLILGANNVSPFVFQETFSYQDGIIKSIV